MFIITIDPIQNYRAISKNFFLLFSSSKYTRILEIHSNQLFFDHLTGYFSIFFLKCSIFKLSRNNSIQYVLSSSNSGQLNNHVLLHALPMPNWSFLSTKCAVYTVVIFTNCRKGKKVLGRRCVQPLLKMSRHLIRIHLIELTDTTDFISSFQLL